jgi:hypothetical protein
MSSSRDRDSRGKLAAGLTAAGVMVSMVGASWTAVAPVSAGTLVSATANSAVRASVIRDAGVNSLSCAPGGACAGGGQYVDASSRAEAFVLTEMNGQWGTAIEVPGLAALGAKYSSVASVSCAAGGCAAGGFYKDDARGDHAFVANERNGRWSRLTKVLSARKAPPAHNVVSLSCSGPGNCTAGGGKPAFVVSEVNGRWGRAHQFGAKGNDGNAKVSCASAGNCTASWNQFVVGERNGRWGKPMALPGLSAHAHVDSGLGIESISCTSGGNCLVGGLYPSSHRNSAFVASERNGQWGKAMEIPGYLALNQTSYGLLASVSCVSAGNCVVGGSYTADADFAGGVYEPFVASERNGHWGKAIEVPGIPPPGNPLCEPDSSACVAGQVLTVSCGSGGTCAAGGWYDTPAISGEAAFVTVYKNGRWTKVTQIPGLQALDTAKHSSVRSVSCTPTGKCAAGGRYQTTQIGPAFVADENNGIWGQAHTILVRS